MAEKGFVLHGPGLTGPGYCRTNAYAWTRIWLKSECDLPRWKGTVPVATLALGQSL